MKQKREDLKEIMLKKRVDPIYAPKQIVSQNPFASRKMFKSKERIDK